MKLSKALFQLTLVAAIITAWSVMAPAADIPDPDGKPADMAKPVQVFIVMGQSNTLEMGKVGGGEGSLENAVKEKNLYPYLVDDQGNWTTRMDVRNVSVMQKRGRTNVYRNEWLTVDKHRKIGIEIGIGNALGAALDAPVMILKSSIGNRSLGWDLLPPGAPRFEFEEGSARPTSTAATRQESATVAGRRATSRNRRSPRGMPANSTTTTWPTPRRSSPTSAPTTPVRPSYEVAGFLWWQGDKDRYNAGHAACTRRTSAP
jgi:hypothetical protein